MDETAKSSGTDHDTYNPFPAQWWEKALIVIIVVGIVGICLGLFFDNRRPNI